MGIVSEWVSKPVIDWLTRECEPEGLPLTDFGQLCQQVQPADVILVEGRTRVSAVIQAVTLSAWTHAALYVGRLDELPDPRLADRLVRAHGWEADRQLVVEAEMGQGTVVMPLDKYHRDHLRICRPRSLVSEDQHQVIEYALSRVGTLYDVRQILDLLRFFFPYQLLPRRWRSSLFEVQAGEAARTVCSTLIASAFMHVRYPILPTIQRGNDGGYVFRRRNAKLFVPRDFDYSPYFEIVKYPFLGSDVELYRHLTWDDEGVVDQPVADTADEVDAEQTPASASANDIRPASRSRS